MIVKVVAILWKDLLSEFRTKEMILSMLVFSLMVAVIFNFAFPPGSEFIQEAASGIIWMTFIFASLLGMNRSFVYEVDKGCLQGLMLAPVDRTVIYISKLLVNLFFITLVEIVVLPLFSIFFHLDLFARPGPMAGIMFISTTGFAVVGTLFSAIAVNTKTREVMLPILHFPISIPIIMSAVQGTSAILQGEEWPLIWGWMKIILAFDVIFFIISLLTFEYIIEE